MIGRLIVVCFAVVAALAVCAGSASAQHGVVVENPGSYEAESEVDLGFFTHVLGTEVPEFSCENHWDVDINSTGEGFVNAEGIFEHPGDGGECSVMEPCDNHAVWPLEIEENPAPETPFELHMTFCLENTGVILPVSTDVECAYDPVTNVAHCDQTISSGLEFEGEIVVHGDPGVTHG